MVITPTSTGIVDPKALDPLRKGTFPLDVYQMSEKEALDFNTRFNQHRFAEVDS